VRVSVSVCKEDGKGSGAGGEGDERGVVGMCAYMYFMCYRAL